MWYFLYNVLLVLAAPFILLILLAKKRCRRGLPQRLGLSGLSGSSGLFGSQPDELEKPDKPEQPVIWVHAVSLGEVVAAAPLVRELSVRHPGFRIVISTVTETGREAVEQRLAGVAEHCYAPLDFPWAVSRAINRLNPSAFLFIETELWPNLLRTLSRRNIPSILINGRLSSRSFRRYSWLRAFMKQILEGVPLCLMQSWRDVQRIVALGARPERVLRTGNIKFDQPVPVLGRGAGDLTREVLGLGEKEELIVAGSTHPGEEQELLACYGMLRREHESLVLLLAPRHVERAAEVERVVRQSGFVPVRRSLLPGRKEPVTDPRPRVLILDTRGELLGIYRHAVVAYVGGTLVPVGGHNLLEPALWGKPVLFGPHTDHCEELAELLIQAEGGRRVRDGEDLASAIRGLLRDRGALTRMGQAAEAVVSDNQGAVGRCLEHIDRLLPPSGTNPPHITRPGQAPRWPLLALAIPYGLLVRARLALYGRGLLPRHRLPRRVISVGNLTLGGTGKTPMVIAIVTWLQAQGQRVGVLSRGYRRRSRAAFVLVSDGSRMLVGPEEAGDEPYLIASRCPGAVVAVGSNRFRLGRWVLERFPLTCLVLDDGFQHLALHRDVDLLLVDASRPDGLGALFPAGGLREPLSGAARASALIVTRADSGTRLQGILDPIRAAAGRNIEPVLARFTAEGLCDPLAISLEPLSEGQGRSALAFSGIGNPASFRRMVESLGIRVLDELVFSDHHAYTRADMEVIRSRAKGCRADLVVTTEKDVVKIRPLLVPADHLRAVRLGTEIFEGRERLEGLLMGNDEQ